MKNSMLENLLKTIADITGEPEGAFNLRKDGVGVMRHSTENIEIKTKEDKPGIDIIENLIQRENKFIYLLY